MQKTKKSYVQKTDKACFKTLISKMNMTKISKNIFLGQKSQQTSSFLIADCKGLYKQKYNRRANNVINGGDIRKK